MELQMQVHEIKDVFFTRKFCYLSAFMAKQQRKLNPTSDLKISDLILQIFPGSNCNILIKYFTVALVKKTPCVQREMCHSCYYLLVIFDDLNS